MSLIDKALLRQFKKTVPSNPELKNTCMYLNGWNDAIECILHNAKDVEAVDAKFIINLIQSSSGAESKCDMRITFSSSIDGIDIYVEDEKAHVTVSRTVDIDDLDNISAVIDEMIEKLSSASSMLSNFKKEHDKRKEIWNLFINE